MYAIPVADDGPEVRPEVIVGERVRRLRQVLGMSQDELARRMRDAGFNWRQSTAAKTEAADRPLRVDEAVPLAAILGTSLDALVHARDASPLERRREKELNALLAFEQEHTERQRALTSVERSLRFINGRLAALGALEAFLNGDPASLEPAIRGVITHFVGNDEWISILSEVGYDRALLTRLVREAERDLRPEEIDNEEHGVARAIARRVAERVLSPDMKVEDG